MPPTVELSVRFAEFGANFYVQSVICKRVTHRLIQDDRFANELMPFGTGRARNEVVGLADPFRFFNQILQSERRKQGAAPRSMSALQESLSGL